MTFVVKRDIILLQTKKKGFRKIKQTKEQMRNYKRVWARKQPEKHLFIIARCRAKKNNIPFEITEEDITIPKKCPILDIPLSSVLGSMKEKQTSPSLDRIDNSAGYIKGNVAVISFAANRLKGNLSPETLKKILRYMEGKVH